MQVTSKRSLIPEHIRQMRPYIPGKTIEEVQQNYKPERISKLASNENRLGYSPKVPKAVENALKEAQDYPDPIARELKSELASLHDVKESELIIGNGSESVLAMLARTFLVPNDEVITAEVTFVGIFVQAAMQQAKLQKVPLTMDYRYDVDGIVKAINGNTRMIYIANPNNPTGTYLRHDELRYLANEAPEDVLIVVDEAYYEYACDIAHYPESLELDQPNVITLRTFSKAYGLAGFRIGYGIANEELIRMLHKTKLVFEPSTPAQAAALAALKDQDFIRKSCEMVDDGRDRLYTFLGEVDIEYIPSIANSVMMLFDTGDEAAQFTEFMMKKGVILRQLTGFGISRGVRITIGTREEMDHFEESCRAYLRQ